MKKNDFIFRLTLTMILIFSVTIANSQSRRKPSKVFTSEYNIWSLDDNLQEKGDLKVEVIPLTPGPETFYKYPKMFSFSTSELPVEMTNDYKRTIHRFFPEYNNRQWTYTFGFDNRNLSAFKVKITNNTNHILRMEGVRIYLRFEEEDPIAAVTRLGNYQLERANVGSNERPVYEYRPSSYLKNDGSIISWLTYCELEWEQNRKKGIIYTKYPIGLTSQIIKTNRRHYKLINDVDREILPGDPFEGILVFPVEVKDLDANLKFYDLCTKTDDVGTCAQKETFYFKLKLKSDMAWWETNEKKWVAGEPPHEWKKWDRKQKKWIYFDNE
jgi:hypothetical protein